MTEEMDTVVCKLMQEVASMRRFSRESDFTEEMGEEVCDRCPYSDRCDEDGLLWGCQCWEASMGEDL